ncbi:MAG TPA: PASTA domain-containing protein [Candidatus Deferrimicrobiaceae bacterium]|jgi:RHS repeat-associated protein
MRLSSIPPYKFVPTILLLSLLLIFTSASHAGTTITQTLSGPERFNCSSGTSTRTFSCPATQGAFTMNVVNGNGNGASTISSAIITINGTTVVSSKDLNANVKQISKNVTNLVKGNNTLTVQTKTCGAGSYLTVTITGVYTLEVKITSPVAGAQIVSRSTAVSGTYAAYSGASFTIKVNNVSANASGGTFSAASVPLAGGSNVLNAVLTTSDGLSDSDNVTINSNLPPVAEAGPNMNVRIFDNVMLDGRTSSDPEGALITYRWSLAAKPQGSASIMNNNTSVTPFFMPDLQGTYIPQLIVNDGFQDSVPDNLAVTAVRPNPAPTANAGADQSVITGSQVNLDGTLSFDPDGDPISYTWRFLSRPPASVAALSNPNDNVSSFIADKDGQYLLELIVNDGQANSLPDNVAIVSSTPNAPPVAFAGQDQTISRGSMIHLDGTGSYDPENQPLIYAWSIVSLPTGSTSLLDNVASPTPALPADKLGDYVVRLTVNDGALDSAPDTVIATALNDAPLAVASASASNVTVGTAVTLDGSASHDPNDDPISYAWSVVSAPVGSTANVVNITSAVAFFSPDKAGSYTINLVVNDGLASSLPSSVGITAYIPTVSVPDVGGLPQANAQTAIVNAGLIAGIVTNANSDNVTAGNVIGQSPVAGSIVPQGSGVNLTVSSGPLMAVVPTVTGLSQAAAQSAIVAADLSVGSVTTANSSTVAAGNVLSQMPDPGTSVIHGTAVNLVISLGPRMVSVPVLLGMIQAEYQSALASAPLSLGTISNAHSDTVALGRVISQNPKSGTSILQDSPIALVLSQGPEPVVIPPDPLTVISPIDPTVATSTFETTRFLYTGSNPIQTGVLPETINIHRAAVLRGKVKTRDDVPLSGVKVTLLNHTEFGQTFTRNDGMFDLAVNGGGLLIVNYTKPNYLPVQRQITPGWQDYSTLPDIVMVSLDNQVTVVDAASPAAIQVVRGSVTSDSSGTRQSTLFFSNGTQPSIVFPDNSSRLLPTINVRATEYTIGDNGPSAMPADLPATTGYTYCVELSADEAVVAGATEVRFDKPVYYYLENFRGFSVGTAVPNGYYDRNRGMWIPDSDGRVVKILGITNGMADLDTDGNSVVDNAATLAALEITDAERTQLASLYSSGTILWRVPITHFSPHDFNWMLVPVAGATPPSVTPPVTSLPISGCTANGSIIECQNQVLGEQVGITGSPFSLNYRSDRSRGRKDRYTLRIALSGATVPSVLRRIDLQVYVGGKRFVQSFPNIPNQIFEFIWDGMDAYGRKMQGSQPVTVRLGNVYPALYVQVGAGTAMTRSFMQAGGGSLTTNSGAMEATLWQTFTDSIGTFSTQAGLGGWTLSVNHAYDPVGRVLYPGNGLFRSVTDTKKVITTIAGSGQSGLDPGPIKATQGKLLNPYDVAVAPDGTIYIADLSNNRIRRVGTDGIMTTFAGRDFYPWGSGPDNVLATQSGIGSPSGVAIGPDGSVYISDSSASAIRRVGPDNIIRTVAGTGMNPNLRQNTSSGIGDGGLATHASLNMPFGLAVAADGTLYFADYGDNRIRRIGTDGIINTVAGTGYWCDMCALRDGGQARNAVVPGPNSIAIDRSGNLYIAHYKGVRKVTPGGVISSLAISGQTVFNGDGLSSTQPLMNPYGIAVQTEGVVYFSDLQNNRVRRIDSSGVVTSLAGIANNGSISGGYSGDGGLPSQANFNMPRGIAFGPDGSLFIADQYNYRIRKISTSASDLSVDDIRIASEDGSELYIFNGSGKHMRTLDALTGAVRYRFGYDDTHGYLTTVTDFDNNVTTVERDLSGNPQAIRAPGGQRTSFTLDSNDYLASISTPAGNTSHFVFSNDGLLNEYRDENDFRHLFHYDPMGRLDRDDDPEGGFTKLDRLDGSGNFLVKGNTAEGRITNYLVENYSTGASKWTNTFPTGAISLTVMGTDGKTTITSSDNTISEITKGPDPRWSMESPIPAKVSVMTPGGLVATTTLGRSVSLSNSSDPMSLISQTDTLTVNGKTATQIYNASTKKFTMTTYAGRQSVAGIDNAGRPTVVNIASTVDNVLFRYDRKGRLDNVVQGASTWKADYDGMNRLTAMTDPDRNSVMYGYDNADRVASVTLPSGRSYGFGYDPAGNTISIRMPNGAVHGLGYTRINLDNAYTPPGNPSYGTKYNADREWVRTTLPSGRAIDGGYDNGGRIRSTVYPEASIAFGYTDNTDRVMTFLRTSAADNATQTMSFSYDGFLTTRIASSGQSTGEYRYAYNNDFAVSSFALDNVWTSLARDNDGLLTQYGRYTIGRAGPAGAPSSLTDNTLSVGYSYDNFGRLATRTHTVAGQQRYQITLGYDNVGRISRKTEIVAGASHVFDFGYDLDGQLTDVFKDGSLAEHYGFDNNSNRTSTLAASATYDAQDRLIQQGGVSYTFDVDGYLTNRGADTFSYSARGELLSTTAGGQTVTYQYDAMARRVARTAAGATTQYLYGNPGQPFQLTASRAPDNTLTTYFYETSGNLFAFERGGQRYYVATDQLGTPKVVTDNAGNVIKQAEYDAWGVKISDTNPALDLPVGFAGGIPEGATGLVRFGFRDYEPATARWTARDPILFEGGQGNLYGYVDGDPVSLIDPSGLFVIGRYDQRTGELHLSDFENGRSVSGKFFSGGPRGAPVPNGYYDILFHGGKGKEDFYRLESVDRIYGDDTHNRTGRTLLRLHRPGGSAGCVTSSDNTWREWRSIKSFIDSTLTDSVKVRTKSRNPFISTDTLTRYGRIRVVGSN